MIYRAGHPDLQQEDDVVPRRAILGVLASVLAIFALLIAWAWHALRKEEATIRPSRAFPERTYVPRRDVQKLQERLYDGEGAGQALKKRQREALRSFGWVDRDKGIVSIPIDDAISIVSQEGGQ
jgi:hypothetical protein